MKISEILQDTRLEEYERAHNALPQIIDALPAASLLDEIQLAVCALLRLETVLVRYLDGKSSAVSDTIAVE